MSWGSGGTGDRGLERVGAWAARRSACRARRCRSGSCPAPPGERPWPRRRRRWRAPSDRSTIADGGCFLSAPRSSWSASWSASPVAVAPLATCAVDDRARGGVVGDRRLRPRRASPRTRPRRRSTLRRQLVDERVGGLLGGGQPGRLDVSRGHRPGVIGDEHHRRLIDRGAVADVRAGERERERRDRRQRERRREVAPPRAAGRRRRAGASTPPGTGPRSAGRAGARRPTPRSRSGSAASAASHSGEAKLIAGGARAPAASPRRWRARRGRRAGGAARGPTSSRRSRSSSANRSRTRRREVSTSIRAPVSGSTRARCPTAGSSASRGSAISTASTECRTRSEPAAAPSPADRGSREITTTSPGWRASRPTRCSASAERRRGRAGRRARRPRRASAAARRSRAWTPRGGSTRGAPAPNATSADAAGPPHPEPPEHERDALGDVRLQPLARCRTPSTARRRARSRS